MRAGQGCHSGTDMHAGAPVPTGAGTGDDARHRQLDHGGSIGRSTESARRRQHLELGVMFL